MTPGPPALGDALAWLDRHFNLERTDRSLVGDADRPSLERVRALCALMGDPQRDYPIVHVTGTNGKGSTTALVAALLRAQGLSTGTMTSPHLEAVNELIATDNGPITDTDLTALLETLAAFEGYLVDQAPGSPLPTWFELVTAAGFRYFSDCAVEAAVIEVGLGGRHDATNVADATVAVVTNVELDHVELIGPDRASIAREKAGIIKPGSWVVVGETDDEIISIFEDEVRDVGAAGLWRFGEDFEVSGSIAHGGRVLDLRTPGGYYEGIFVSLFGAHQGHNAAVALASVEAFFGAPLSEDVVHEAFGSVHVAGRLEILERRPTLLLDGAHNPAGAAALGRALAEDFSSVERIIVVFGCLVGRDPAELLGAIGTDRVVRVIATTPDSPRAQQAEAIAAALVPLGLPVDVIDNVPEALDAARSAAQADDLIVVTGTLQLVGAARAAIRGLSSPRP